jgi:hypothetical protein
MAMSAVVVKRTNITAAQCVSGLSKPCHQVCVAVMHLAHVQPATYTWTAPQGILYTEVLVVGGKLCHQHARAHHVSSAFS